MKTSSQRPMKFPVISFKLNNNFIYYFEKEEELLTTTEELLKNQVFKGYIIIDTDGFMYKFKNAKKVGYVGFFGINPLLKGWWRDREISVEMEFEPNIEKMELESLKRIAKEKVEKSKQIWKEAWDIKDLTHAIDKAETYLELLTLFK
jgi:hypothetical protein